MMQKELQKAWRAIEETNPGKLGMKVNVTLGPWRLSRVALKIGNLRPFSWFREFFLPLPWVCFPRMIVSSLWFQEQTRRGGLRVLWSHVVQVLSRGGLVACFCCFQMGRSRLQLTLAILKPDLMMHPVRTKVSGLSWMVLLIFHL